MKFGIYVFDFSKINLLAFLLASQEMYTLTQEAWPLQNCQNFQRTGETDSGRAQTEPCPHQNPGERSSDPTRD